MAERLRTPGSPPEQLVEAVSFRRADGREGSLRELSPAQLLGGDATLHAEEVVLSVPNGRSVQTLMNATPVRTDDGPIRSVVVTLLDAGAADYIGRPSWWRGSGRCSVRREAPEPFVLGHTGIRPDGKRLKL